MAILCFWPPESWDPPSPSLVSYLRGRPVMNSSGFRLLGCIVHSSLEVRVSRVHRAHCDVLEYGRPEQHGLLAYESQVLPEPPKVQRRDVGPVTQDLAAHRSVKPLDEADDGAFA